MQRSLLLLLSLASVLGLSTPAAADPPRHSRWQLSFSDEFDGKTLDGSKSIPRYQWGSTHNYNAYCDPRNVLVENGRLRLKVENKPSHGKKYTSAVITSYDKFSQKYGYFEGRFRIPAGKGFWPAFWLLPYPQRWPPEIDIFETIRDDPHVYMTFHWKDGRHRSKGAKWTDEEFSFARELHNYGVEWDPEKIVWYIDGVERARFAQPKWIPNMPMYIIINFGIDAKWPGPTDGTTPFPSHYECDWIRVYRKAAEGDKPAPEKGRTAQKAGAPVLRHSEVAFMYASTAEAYKAYGATFIAWGGANTPERVKMHHDLGIRCTGSVWCLTARARTLYENENLRAAVAIDIERKPIQVPWQFDKVYKGQTTDFGNTNHPAFREHVKANVRRVMAGGADGLHVDDHLGVASPAHWHAGGFDDYSIDGFREYLKQHATAEQLETAGVTDLETFDYRSLVRRYGKTAEEVKRQAGKIPLFDLWKRYHLEAAADFVAELRGVAEEAAGHPVLLSANACLGNEVHHYVVPRLTHVVCEVWFNGHRGTAELGGALKAYEAAHRLGRPLACTASGHDWAHVKAHDVRELVRFWIALTYAHGQRFMVPHPSRQWCFNRELGTHWYQAPIEEFAPVYRFIKANASVLDGFEAAGEVTVTAPPTLMCRVRRKGSTVVVHAVNLDYDAGEDRMREAKDARIGLPASLVADRGKAQLISYGSKAAADLSVRAEGDRAYVTVPGLRLWALVVIE